jgi:hypothetical protein
MYAVEDARRGDAACRDDTEERQGQEGASPSRAAWQTLGGSIDPK